MKTNNDKVKKLNILVIEDDEINYLLIREVLSELKVELYHASSGLQAIKIFKNNDNINLVLMDIKLPDISGLEITKQMKSIKPEIPIIAQSAYALIGDKEKAFKAGCDDYITKPIMSSDLIRIVNKFTLKGEN